MPYNNFFAKNLLYLREHRNLKQADIQEELGIMRNTWSNWENGKSEPSQENLFKIAQFFGVDVGNLLSEDMSLLSDDVTVTKDDGNGRSYAEIATDDNVACRSCETKDNMIDLQKQTIKALQGQVDALLMAMKLSAKTDKL